MRIRLVIDILGGQVVRGVAGDRDSYRPIESVLTTSTAPRDVARAFRDELGHSRVYVADLDGIVHGRPDVGLLADLVADGFDVIADVGVRCADDARTVAESGVDGIIVALETLPDPEGLREIVAAFGERVVFSLDLKSGVPMRIGEQWPADPLAIAEQVVDLGVGRMVVLDLSGVGMSGGVPTTNLCHSIRTRFPGLAIITGGGVRSEVDLVRVAECGADECLVASAVHDGTLRPRDRRSPGPGRP